MVLATQQEIDKRQQKLEGYLRGLDEEGKLSEKKLCTQIRSAIRQVWMKHDVKLALLYKKTYPDTDPSTRTKWLVDCGCCGEPTKLSQIECDHKKGEHPLNTLDDVLGFAQSILGVGFDDLQLVCKDCHAAITYSERYNLSLEDAFKEKEVIAKLKQKVTDQKKELKYAGFKPKEYSNEEKRRECYRIMINRR